MADETTLQTVDDKLLKDFLLGSDTKLSDKQTIMFMNLAKAFNLNPFKREIYAIPFERSVMKNWVRTKVADMSLVTWYQVYIERAMRSWLLDWWNVETVYRTEKKEDWTEAQKIDGARITIHRKDWKNPFERFVGIKEFAKLNKEWRPQGSWGTMPEFMIKKVAIGQGFRLAFPAELNWMPYLSEEITTESEKTPIPSLPWEDWTIDGGVEEMTESGKDQKKDKWDGLD